MDESIKLDRRSFEALAGETRVRALKSLLKRRKTLTELSSELGLSPSTMKEHLGVLSGAGLVVQVDEGRKWKYYELTGKGRSIAEPHELRVWIILGLSIIAAGAAVLNMLIAMQPAQEQVVMEEMLAAGAAAPEAAPMAADRSIGIAQESAETTVPFIQIGVAASALLILVWAVFYARKEGVF
ncbi:MAG: winged helix-turn-helix domain-containing protein [Candidatus Micrarchaeota archaeon]